jgi:hypothetical protein
MVARRGVLVNIKLRAVATAGLLAGFSFLGSVAVVGAATASAVFWAHGEPWAGVIAAVATCGLAVLLSGPVLAWLRARTLAPEGIALSETRAPALWAHVRSVAAELGTREPTEIWLVSDATIRVQEDATLLGLWSQTRSLRLGAPLLVAFEIGQLRAAVAHELGRYADRGLRFAGLSVLGYDSIARTMDELGPRDPSAWLLRGLLRAYARVSLPVRQRQALAADEAMADVAGAETAIRTLTDLPAIAGAWRLYLDGHVNGGWRRPYAPSGLTRAFGELIAAGGPDLDDLPAAPTRAGDATSPLAERIAALEHRGADPAAGQPDSPPAWVLVPDVDAFCDRLDEQAFDLAGRTRLPFLQYVATVATSVEQENADALYAAAGRLLGWPEAGLGDVLDLLAAGRLSELAAAVAQADWSDHQARKHAVDLVGALLNAAMAAAAVRSGAANWEYSWTGPPRLVDRGGSPLRLRDLVWRAILQKDAVRAVSAELARFGIDERAGHSGQTPPARVDAAPY